MDEKAEYYRKAQLRVAKSTAKEGNYDHILLKCVRFKYSTSEYDKAYAIDREIIHPKISTRAVALSSFYKYPNTFTVRHTVPYRPKEITELDKFLEEREGVPRPDIFLFVWEEMEVAREWVAIDLNVFRELMKPIIEENRIHEVGKRCFNKQSKDYFYAFDIKNFLDKRLVVDSSYQIWQDQPKI